MGRPTQMTLTAMQHSGIQRMVCSAARTPHTAALINAAHASAPTRLRALRSRGWAGLRSLWRAVHLADNGNSLDLVVYIVSSKLL